MSQSLFTEAKIQDFREQIGSCTDEQLELAIEGALALAEKGGFLEQAKDVSEDWKAGYRQCMLDFIDEITDTMGVEL